MEKIVQAIELTIIGMGVVFIVLSLLTLLLNLMGKFMAPEVEESKKELNKRKKQQGFEDKKSTYVAENSSSNPKVAAAITAALKMYESDNN
jgi:sodium pump decarboxylase gamma subunit